MEVFASKVPPVAALYHAKDVPAPDATKDVVKPAVTVAEGGPRRQRTGKCGSAAAAWLSTGHALHVARLRAVEMI